MTISEIYNAFKAQFEIEVYKRDGKSAPEFSPKTFALFISEAQQDIQRKLKVLLTATNISLTSGTNAYALPTNFGSDSMAVYLGQRLTRISNEDFYSNSLENGDPTQYSIVTNDATPALIVHPKPTQSGTLNLVYYPDTGYYQPSESSDQDWGTFDGSSFDGSLLLPRKYLKAVLLYLLSKWFKDYEDRYLQELQSLKYNGMPLPTRRYKIGGLSNPRYTIGSSNNAATDEVAVDTVAKGTADRIYTFYIDEGDTSGTQQYRRGFSNDVSVSMSSYTITVTSGSAEFTVYTLVTAPGMNWYRSDASTIIVEAYSGFTNAIIKIESWVIS